MADSNSRVQSTRVSVSGRGTSTSGVTCSIRPRNSRSPTRYASGSPVARRDTSLAAASSR